MAEVKSARDRDSEHMVRMSPLGALDRSLLHFSTLLGVSWLSTQMSYKMAP